MKAKVEQLCNSEITLSTDVADEPLYQVLDNREEGSSDVARNLVDVVSYTAFDYWFQRKCNA